jgi:hypothetical protein
MIVFDLRCGHGHVFESWFGSSAEYEAQLSRNLISCPVCDDTRIGKALMAPAIPAKGNRFEGGAPAEPLAKTPDLKNMMKDLAEMQAKVERECDYVGREFAEEARSIHYGESETRGIYGEATPTEAESLREEGIGFAPLPFRNRDLNA